MNFRNKNILVMGLGMLGGGVATAKWLVGQGAEVTVTDLKTREELADSVQELERECGKDMIRFVLGGHKKEDFASADFIVINPAVPRESEYLKDVPREKLLNDALIFFNTVKNPIIAVTGTRGKTTTANWIAHFLKPRWPNVQVAGNTPENPLLKELERVEALRLRSGGTDRTPAVVELSSWQLEYLPESHPASVPPERDFGRAWRAPDIAIITNLYPDHMNRYSSMEEYALAKANIFKNQTEKQFLILNKENEWTEWFLEQKPKSQVRYTSSSEISEGVEGEHNIQNLQAASLAANLMRVSWENIRARVSSLPSVPFRQEVIFENDKLLIINDSASTSPEAGIAALRRFSLEARRRDVPFFFIAGGTNKGLSYERWVEEVQRARPILFLLEGSVTEKMKYEILRYRDVEMSIYRDLETIIKDVKKKVDEAGGGVVVFSPSAASFEKFKNEFDRGEQFNELAQKYFSER